MSHRKCHTADQLVLPHFKIYLITLKIDRELFKNVNINQENQICNMCAKNNENLKRGLKKQMTNINVSSLTLMKNN